MSPDQPLSQGFQIVNFIVKYISDFRLYDGSDLKTYLLMRW